MQTKMNRKGQIGAGLLATLIVVGISAFVLVTLWSSASLNCVQGNPYNVQADSTQCRVTGSGLYTTVTGTFMPILALGVTAAVIIRLFG